MTPAQPSMFPARSKALTSARCAVSAAKPGGKARSAIPAPAADKAPAAASTTAPASGDTVSHKCVRHRPIFGRVSAASGGGTSIMAACTSARSRAVRAMTPTVSNPCAAGSMPEMGQAPWVGLNPATPQNEAGRSTEPPV